MSPRLLLLFFLSGFTALVYQLVWTRWLGLLLGNFATATATVVTVFMGGLAAGNWLVGGRAARLSPRAALRLYAWLEAALALLAAASPLVLASSSPLAGALARLGGTAAGRAALASAALLPPTILMGGTLPALVRAVRSASPGTVGLLYAVNTIGGALGPLAAAFGLMPLLGLKLTCWTAAAVNLGVAVAAFRLARGWPADPDAPPAAPAAANEPPGAGVPRALPYLLAALSGFIALGFEIGLTRLIVLLITGGSVYGFAIILSSFLAGIAFGAWLLRRFPPASPRAALLGFAAAQAVTWGFSLTTPFWDAVPVWLVRIWWNPLPFGLLAALNFFTVIGLLLVFTTASGYALPALVAALGKSDSRTVGGVFAANTLGAVAGAPLTGFVLLSALGVNLTLQTLGAAALAAGAAAAVLAVPRRWQLIVIPLPVLGALSFVLPAPSDAVMNAGMYNRPQGFKSGPMSQATPDEAAHRLGRIIYQKDSLTARIAVRAISGMEMAFIVNGKPDGSTSLVDMYTQIFMAHLPALAHPRPKRVLVIGMGTGTTTGCLTLHPEVEEVHLVEIEPAQVEVARWFGQHNYHALDNLKVRVHLDDARHFLATDQTKYDVIVSEPSNLFVSGMVNLFTEEFYRSVRAHLNPGGVFFQWIHYYRVRPEDVRGMLGTFTGVFPDTTFWLHQFGDAFMLARDGGVTFDLKAWDRRLEQPAIAQDFKRIQLVPPSEVLGFYLWGPKDVIDYAAGAAPCTDDRPYLEFTTPRIRYTQQDVQDIRVRLQARGPLEPMPLARDDAATRMRLGDMFFARGSLGRAEAEYRQALALSPGSRAARERLKRVQELKLASGAPPSTAFQESFTP